MEKELGRAAFIVATYCKLKKKKKKKKGQQNKTRKTAKCILCPCITLCKKVMCRNSTRSRERRNIKEVTRRNS